MSDSQGKPEQHPRDASPVSPSLQTPQADAGGSFLMTIPEVAAFLCLTREAVFQRIHKGGFPDGIVLKLGASVRFDRQRLIDALYSGKLAK